MGCHRFRVPRGARVRRVSKRRSRSLMRAPFSRYFKRERNRLISRGIKMEPKQVHGAGTEGDRQGQTDRFGERCEPDSLPDHDDRRIRR